MTGPLVIVIGASAGGIQALTDLVARLPAHLPATLLIVVHIPPDMKSHLHTVLQRASLLPVSPASTGEPLRPGHIYCAVADHHLLVEGDRLAVTRGPKENRFRPSIDALFRSAAYSHTTRVAGVVLSGMLDDGTSGLWTIKRLGGLALVQDPQEAEYDSMPLSALSQVEVDDSLSVPALAQRLIAWTQLQRAPEETEVRLTEEERARLETETGIAKDGRGLQRQVLSLGTPSQYACPECHGVLLQLQEGGRTRYRCHVGHAYSASALLAQVSETVQLTLGQARRAMEEAALLSNRLGDEHLARGDARAARTFHEQAQVALTRSLQLLALLDDTSGRSDVEVE
ncbi:chemotaxis protein CheB [Deinococcus sonorensis]|uniref:protein-glutamate methylesterase n=2 Tax=Deinococcus sonorensis TaxID=309891 RepID=A0AAU7U620_9DEIO